MAQFLRSCVTLSPSRRLYQLTWRSPRVWSFAADDFEDAKLLQARMWCVCVFYLRMCVWEVGLSASCAPPSGQPTPSRLPPPLRPAQSPLTDGWGVTTDGRGALVLGDSSHRLHFVDPGSMKRLRTISVTGARPWASSCACCRLPPLLRATLLPRRRQPRS